MSTALLRRQYELPSSARPVIGAALSSIAVLVLTSVHHAYGAIAYGTPWRLHMVHTSAFVALLIGGLFFVAWKLRDHVTGELARWLAIMVAIAFPITMIGMFEGGYNHLIKNFVYFGGGAISDFRKLFPPPMYEQPNDLIFEATGIAQYFAGLIAAAALPPVIRRDQ